MLTEGSAIDFSLALFPLPAFQPPPHAPASGACAARTEQRFEVGPTVHGEGMKRETHSDFDSTEARRAASNRQSEDRSVPNPGSALPSGGPGFQTAAGK